MSKGLSSRNGQKYRKKCQTIQSNLKQYGLEDRYVDILAADFSTSYLRKNYKFDAIISDPPYGIREKAKKIGNKDKIEGQDSQENKADSDSENTLNSSEDKNGFHWVSVKKTKYMLSEIFYDLMIY